MDDNLRRIVMTGIIVAGFVILGGFAALAITLYNYWGLR